MPSGSIFVFPFLVGLACAIYEDQIGILDWNQRFLGKISFIQYDFTSGLSNYFLGSRQNVIASLSRKNGSIAWRQVLESAETLNHFVLCSNVVFSVSSRHSLLRAWDSDLGFLLWEKAFEYPGEITSSDILCDGNRVFLVYPTKLLSFRVNAGERISEIGLKLWPDIPQRVRVMSAKSPSDHIVVVGASFSPSGSTNLMVAVLATPSSSSGDAVIKNVQTHALNSHVDIINCNVNGESSSSSEMYLVCVSTNSTGTASSLHTLPLKTGAKTDEKTRWITVKSDQIYPRMRSLDGSAFVLSSTSGVSEVFSVTSSGLPVRKYLIHNASFTDVAHLDNRHHLFTASHDPAQPFKNFLLSVYDADTGLPVPELPSRHWTIAQHHGAVESIHAHIFVDSNKRLSFRLLVLTEDGAVQLLRQNGLQKWIREEALADIVAVEMVDLPVSESQARMEEEFGHTHRNIFEMFAVRLRTQALQLWAYLRSCLSGASHSLTAAVFPKSSDPQSANRRVVNDDEVTLGTADPSSELPTSYPPRLRMPTISNPNEQPMQHRAVDNDDDPIRSGGGYRQLSTSMYEFLTRDNFNLHKMIVVATGCGKVFGIESEKGRLVWEHLVRDAQPSTNNRPMLFQQRNTAHFPLPPITTYFSRSKHTGLPVLYSFNPITGAVLQKMSKNLFHMESDILQTILLPGSVSEATEYVRPLLMLDTHLKVHIYPERYTSALKLIRIPLYVYTIEPSLARLIGYKIRSLKNSSLEDEHTAVRVWQMYLHGNGDNANVSTPHSVVAAASRAANEHIHSVGRVLGDRSVLYKYLNPNLLAVITAGGDVAAQTNSVMLYLIDVVLGRVLHSAVHRRCSEPVNLIHSENWIVYGYYNHKSLRHEITVLELFESTKVSANGPQLCASHSIPSPPQLFLRNILPTSWFLSLTSLGPKQGNSNLLGQDASPLGLSDGSDYIFSSLLRSTDVDGTCSGTGASPIVPQILQQSYILTTPPGHGVAAVSLTERGITSKSIILGLQKGALIEIPKSFLDPRRALDLSPELVEEGVHPYAPVLPLSDQAVISYNQSVLGIRAIRTAATGLESTSVVFAHGLDLFFTRIAPSLTYDLLKEDFDYTAIATVTLGMIIASFVTQRLAARRVMLRAWA